MSILSQLYPCKMPPYSSSGAVLIVSMPSQLYPCKRPCYSSSGGCYFREYACTAVSVQNATLFSLGAAFTVSLHTQLFSCHLIHLQELFSLSVCIHSCIRAKRHFTLLQGQLFTLSTPEQLYLCKTPLHSSSGAAFHLECA